MILDEIADCTRWGISYQEPVLTYVKQGLVKNVSISNNPRSALS